MELAPARLLVGRTAATLSTVASRPLAADSTTRVHLVTGSSALLAAVIALPACANWKLHSASWALDGSQAGPLDSRVAVLTLDSFVEFLNFGAQLAQRASVQSLVMQYH